LESRTGAVVVAVAGGLVSLVLADPVSVAGVVAACGRRELGFGENARRER